LTSFALEWTDGFRLGNYKHRYSNAGAKTRFISKTTKKGPFYAVYIHPAWGTYSFLGLFLPPPTLRMFTLFPSSSPRLPRAAATERRSPDADRCPARLHGAERIECRKQKTPPEEGRGSRDEGLGGLALTIKASWQDLRLMYEPENGI
jgi:hypothetical protein